MNIKPVRTEADHKAALMEIENLMTAEFGTPEGDRLDILATLVEAYESKHFPLELPDPVAAIKFTMERFSLTIKDLEPSIGRPSRVYEVLNHTRPLTLRMIRSLNASFGIPVESLIKEAPPTKKRLGMYGLRSLVGVTRAERPKRPEDAMMLTPARLRREPKASKGPKHRKGLATSGEKS